MEEIPYVLTNHVRDRMNQRGVLEKWIAQVLRKPLRTQKDDLKPNVCKAYGYIYEKGNRVLCVVYDYTKSPYDVITAFFE